MKNKIWWMLLGVLIIATFFRTYHLASLPPGLYPDEAMNGSNAQAAIQSGDYKVFYPDNNGREGLFINIQAFVLKLIGQNEPWVLRLPSAIFGTLTVLGLFFFARELWKRDDIALWASLFLALSFWHINFSRIGFRAITSVFFLIWALYFFLSSLSRDSWLRAAIGGIFFGLGFYSYISYRAMPLLFLFFIPFFWKKAGFLKLTSIFIAATFFAALPIGLYYLNNPADFFGRTTQVSVFSSENPAQNLLMNTGKTLGMLNFVGDGNWRHNFSGRPQIFWPVGILMWLGVAYGLREVFKNQESKRFSFLLVFGWIFLASLPVVISNEGIPHALRAILMIPPLYALAGFGAVLMYEKVVVKFPARRILISSFVALLIIEAFFVYFIGWGKNPNVQGAFAADQVALGREIRSLPQAVRKAVVVDAGGVGVKTETPEGEVKYIPMPAQTVMFITDSFTQEGQEKNNIRYFLPGENIQVTTETKVFYIR